MNGMKYLLAVGTLLCVFLGSAIRLPALAQEATESSAIPLTTKEVQFEAEVVKVIKEESVNQYGISQLIQTLQLKGLTGRLKGKTFQVTNGSMAASGFRRYEAQDKVIVSDTYQIDGTHSYLVVDYVRRDALFILFGLFALTTIAVAGWKGVASLGAMIYSFFILFSYVIPQIAAGHNPIVVALLGGLMIIPITFYLSHGFNKKTHAAIIGTVIALLVTGILSEQAIEWAHLTGFATEDANFVQLMSNGAINIKGLLLAGILVGLFGILDDITISQAAIVFQLREASPSMSFSQLYRRSMNIGKDHIGSLINTLILVYAGAALPFLLLLTANDSNFLTTINYEMIAEEIVRTLTASIGLILAVPITTFIATKMRD
jgi:uncharacterized membrane protein